MFRRKRGVLQEIAPEEIFLDSSNASDLDKSRFEGKLEQPLSYKTYWSVGVLLAAIVLTLTARAGYLQVIKGTAYASQSAHNSLESTDLFAPRGVITDRNGVVIAQNKELEDGVLTRHYTLPGMGQIIGYVSKPKKDTSGNYYDKSQTGLAGLEAKYDAVLQGTNGRLLVEKDALGKVRSTGEIIPAKGGAALALSVDVNLEKHFITAIKETADRAGYIAGAGVIMDVATGEVLAIASYPSYDPNVMSAGFPADVIEGYSKSNGHPFLDHAVQGVYSPGSIVKPFVAAGALTDGLITPDTVINDQGKIVVPDPFNPGKNYVFNGWKVLGPLTVDKAVAWSSDIFFYTISGGFGSQKGMGIDRLNYWYQQFGFGTPTAIDLPQEAAGLLPTPEWKERVLKEPWYLGDTYFTSIGQYSMQVTPIQAVRAMAAIANGGKLYRPTLLKQDPTVAPAPVATVPVTPDSLDVVRSGMRFGVTGAIAQMLHVPYVSVAAKTGTAQAGTRNQYDNSWILGFFPYEKPKYAFVIVLERGPAGVPEKAAHAMRRFLDLLKQDDSPYIGGSGATATQTATTSNAL